MDVLGASILISFNVILGLNQALVKVVNAGFSPVFQAGLRSICAILPVLAFALLMKRRVSITDGSLPLGVLNGLLFSLEFALPGFLKSGLQQDQPALLSLLKGNCA